MISSLPEQLAVRTREFRGLKGKEALSVPLSKEVARELDDSTDQNKVLPKDLLLAPPKSEGVDQDNFAKRVFARELMDWGRRWRKFHGFNHPTTTLMLDAQIDSNRAVDLGHKSLETTLRYAHAIRQNVRNAAQTYVLTPSTETHKSIVELKRVGQRMTATNHFANKVEPHLWQFCGNGADFRRSSGVRVL